MTETRTLRFFSLTKLHYDSQGRLRTNTPTMAREWWEPFYRHFSDVVIHARVRTDRIEDGGYFVDHSRLTVVALPYYEGFLGYVRQARRIRKFIRSSIVYPRDYYALWVPSRLSLEVTRQARKLGSPILAVVIGDGAAVAHSIAPSPLKTVLAGYVARESRRAVDRASGVIYVTLSTLQRKYPANPGAISLARPNIQLRQESTKPSSQKMRTTGDRPLSVITVGSQEQNYKGHDLLIDAVAQLQQEGYALRLTVVGEGRLHDALVNKADQLGLQRVTFHKRVGDSSDVAREIARHDLFVMPSRTEGMPKALLEAISVGTLALGADVGGIPEVLEAKCLFQPESSDALAEKLRMFLDDREDMTLLADAQWQVLQSILTNHTGPEILTRFLGDWIQRVDS